MQWHPLPYTKLSPGLFLLASLSGCGGGGLDTLDASIEPTAPPDELFQASVRIEDGPSTAFDADDIVAGVSDDGGNHELVLYARSLDSQATLAFVLDLSLGHVPGRFDLSEQGVLYLEQSAGVTGGDLRFDGSPEGYLDMGGELIPGTPLTGHFELTIPGFDSGRPDEEITANLEGSFVVQLRPGAS